MPNYSYFFDFLNMKEYDVKNKDKCTDQFILYMLNRLQSMFKWDGLPETIPQRSLELFLQFFGHVCFTEYNGDLYVMHGGLGGEPDVYYMPTIYTVANPALNYSANLRINEDCIVMPSDTMYLGLLPIFSRYAKQMTETELSIYVATINSRIINLITAPDDRTKQSAEKYLADVDRGKLGVIAENAFLDGIRSQPYGNTGNSNNITNLIELMQYQKASFFNEIGLNANYNMKRESLNTEESQLNHDALLPLIDDMLKCRQDAAQKVNEKYGLDLRVDFASSWEDNAQELEAEQENIENATEDSQNESAEESEEMLNDEQA